ncbi:hypothetical protein FACS189440_20900 [Bacteroidia bacterium]|nr:hypothetical protein FACS189440_20900 [Bacteroidia bacterium]
MPTKEGIFLVNENGTLQKHFDDKDIIFVFSYKSGIWALGTEGIYSFDKQTGFKKVFALKLTINPVSTTAITDNNGNLIIRDEHHIYRFDGKNLETIFDHETIFDMLLDRENNLWLATYNGLYNLFGLQFKNYTPVKDNDRVRSTFVDTKKNLWLPTYEGHLYRILNDKTFEENIGRRAGVTYFQGFPSQQGNSLYFPGGEESNGILKWTNGKSNWLKINNTSHHIALALPDSNMLFGSFSQIDICKPNGELVRTIGRDSLGLTVSCAIVDKKGRILIGGSTGIVIIDKDKIIVPEQPDNFLGCKSMSMDKSGKIWATSGNSLFIFENDTVRLEHTFSNRVRNVLATRNGCLIVSTLDGINIKRMEDDNFVFYGKNSGFLGEAMELNITEDSVGNVWALSKKYMLRFNPQELLQKQSAPKLYFTGVSSSPDNVKWQPENADFLKLNYKHDNIRFAYIGLSYSAAENVRYHYRLKGFQDEFSEPTKQREVTFNNLKPGDYIFEIYADAGTDESKSEIQTFSFSIKPAFWQTTWFLIILILSLVSLSSLLSLFFLQRRNRALLQKLETERELNDLRIRSIRLRAIPHFNFNVMATIEYYIANRPKEEAMRLLNIYSNFTYETLRRVENASNTLGEELEYIRMYLELEKIRYVDKFDFRIDVPDGVDPGVRLPNMLLHTYCENAIKHGLSPKMENSGNLLLIHIIQHDDKLKISVEDNGVGRQYAQEHPNIRSTKYGLNILNRQIEIYNRFNEQKIIQSIKDLEKNGHAAGTRFSVEVPLFFNYELANH